MTLSFDHLDKLQLHAQIIQDRSRTIEIALESNDNGDVREDELDHIADASVHIIEAAQAIEILCGRLVRGTRYTMPARAK